MCERDEEIARLKRQIDAMRGVSQDGADAEIVLRQRALSAERSRDALIERLAPLLKASNDYREKPSDHNACNVLREAKKATMPISTTQGATRREVEGSE